MKPIAALKICLGVAVGLACAAAAWGDPLRGELRPLRQPDGTRGWVRIWGDEFYQVVESQDGYTLVRDPQTGIICYADLSPDGSALVSTGVALEDAAPAGLAVAPHLRVSVAAARRRTLAVRAEAEAGRYEGAPPWLRDGPLAGPTTGAVQGICLLVDFADDPGTIPPANVNNYCNQVGYHGYGNNGSVRDYFYAVSDGRLTYTNYVPAEYYRAAHPKDYYTDPNISYGLRARELIVEALTDLNNHGFDFSQYDADHDGVIDALNCFYAGYSESAWATGLWPHAWNVSFYADGVWTNAYQISDMGAALQLGTFCHENGHMLCGFPDLYDYDYDSTGVGGFCLMAYGGGGTNPCQPCAYNKCIADWATTTVLTSSQSGLSAPSATNTIYKYNHPTQSNEYYLIENRQQTGRDAGLPASGLAIWHIDTNGNNSWNQMTPTQHFLVTLVQADGRWDLEHNVNYGDGSDLWRGPAYPRCTPATTPNTNWWNGSSSNLSITSISASAATMTFAYDNGVAAPSNPSPANGATGVAVEADLDWADAAGAAAYDVYFGTVNPPPLVGSTVSSQWVLATLAEQTTYYWQVVAKNGSKVAPGPVWSFTTLTPPPDVPSGPSPGTGAVDVSISADLDWADAARATSYDVYFGTTNPPGLVGILTPSYWLLGPLNYQTTYYWKIVAKNSGGSTSGPVWSFTTVAAPTGSLCVTLAPAQAVADGAQWRVDGGAWQNSAATLQALVVGSHAVDYTAVAGWDAPPNEPVQISQGLTTAITRVYLPVKRGDLNCDGRVDFDDINPFVTALVSATAYQAQYPDCRWLNGDLDGSGAVDFNDINPFVECLVNGGCP